MGEILKKREGGGMEKRGRERNLFVYARPHPHIKIDHVTEWLGRVQN